MLTFMRKIRRSLIGSGSTKKYLLYAIGEICLVVIGILIALQINNLNEESKERSVERSYLKNIKIDLTKDREGLNHIIERRKLKEKIARQVMELFHDPGKMRNIGKDEIAFFDLLMWEQFNPNTNALTEIISSGDLRTLTNETIKSGLLNLSATYQNLAVYRDHIRREYENYLYDPFITKYDHADNNFLSREERIRFFNDVTLKNGFSMAAGGNNYLRKLSTGALKDVDQLIELIDSELDED